MQHMGPPCPGSLLIHPRGDKCSKQGKPSQANRGPKNLVRLVLTWVAKREPTGDGRFYGNLYINTEK